MMILAVLWYSNTSSGFNLYLTETVGDSDTYYVDSVDFVFEKDSNYVVVRRDVMVGVFPMSIWKAERK